MTLLYIALPVALLIAAGAVVAFIWAARTDQYEDLETPAIRMLLDEAPIVQERAVQERAASSATQPAVHALPSAHGNDRAPASDASELSS